MKGNRDIFVKVNYKNIGELNSFIYDGMNGNKRYEEKYVMCAGKYDKNGWTIVFKAKDINEAEELLSRNSARRELNRKNQVMNPSMIENERVLIPAWISNN